MLSFLLELGALLLQALWHFLEALWKTWIYDPPKDVKNEVVLVTGAGHGLGREIALRYASLGAHVVLWDVKKEPLENVTKEIKNLGWKATGYVCDVSKPEAIQACAKSILKDVGKVTVLVNNAGVLPGVPLWELEDEQIVQTMRVNLLGHIWTIRCFLPSMMEENRGHIVGVCSIAGYLGCINMVDYCASKYGVRGMMAALTQELRAAKKDGIHLTVASPVTINTGLAHSPSSRFPWLVPILEPGPTADAVIDAMRRNKASVVIPSHVGWVADLMPLLPEKSQLLMQDFIDYKFAAHKKES